MDEVSGWWSGAHHEGRGLDVLALADAAGGFRALIDGGYDALVDAGLEPARAARWVSARPLRTAFTAVTLDSPRYSALLKSIPEPPPVLFVDGDVSALSMPAVAVVGTRSCTSYGSSIARRLGAALAAAGVVTVSGLARGVDAAAHRGAMAVGRTVAVVGHGLGDGRVGVGGRVDLARRRPAVPEQLPDPEPVDRGVGVGARGRRGARPQRRGHHRA
jgi:hypothetical protein